MTAFTVDPLWVFNKKKYPNEALYPVSSGYDEVVFPAGDYGPTKFSPKESARFIADELADMEAVEFKNLIGATFEGGILRSFVFWSAKECFDRFSKIGGLTDSIGVRYLYGSRDCEVSFCDINRTAWINPNVEAGGVLFSYGYSPDGSVYHPNLRCGVKNCTIRGCWTDSVQMCHTVLDKFGECPGCYVEDCTMGFDPAFVFNDIMVDRMEQSGCDFKTGGTIDSPVLFRRNVIYGTYKSVMNPRGYAFCVQNTTTDLVMEDNIIVDCWGGVSLGPPRPESGHFDRRTKFKGNKWRVKDHWCYFTDTCVAENEIIDCGKLEEQPVKPWLAPREFINCSILERGLVE